MVIILKRLGKCLESDKMSQKSYNGTPTLYLVPTPIGNLEDITLRAINMLREAEVVFSEDTRVTLNLLNHLEIKKKIISAHEHNEETAKEKMLSYLKDGYSIAMVTDRGTPVISDPGFRCASYIIENGYNVVGLPGPTALIPALIMSGIEPSPFLFYGFTNNKGSKRRKELESLRDYTFTLILYETPHRIHDMLVDMLDIFGNRRIAIAREISKTFEEVYRGNVKDIIEETIDIKGEIVIIVEGNKEEKVYNIAPIDHVKSLVNDGVTEKDAIKMVSKMHKINKSDLYKEYHTGK
jgi:16S rRNA (cytidine1402-2'-O)-methyltransferase